MESETETYKDGAHRDKEAAESVEILSCSKKKKKKKDAPVHGLKTISQHFRFGKKI